MKKVSVPLANTVSVLSGQPTLHFLRFRNDEKSGLFSTFRLYANLKREKGEVFSFI